MKKIAAVLLVIVLIAIMTIPALAAGNLFSRSNEWFYTSSEGGTLVVRDNKKDFTYDVTAGTNLLGRQNSFTGQLRFVSFEHVCIWVEVTTDPTCTLEGFTTNVCVDNCGNVWGFWWDYTDPLGHDFQSSKFDGHGWWYYDCTRCEWQGYGLCQHDFVWGNYTDPTCVADGYDALLCKYCGEIGGFWNYDEGSAFGHDWSRITWDSWGWWAICDRCGWQGYISYAYCDYADNCDCEDCNPVEPFTVNTDGSITININGFYTANDFGNPGRGNVWRVNINSPVESGRGFLSGNLNAGDIVYRVNNQNQQ